MPPLVGDAIGISLRTSFVILLHFSGASAHGTCYFSGIYGNAYAYTEGIILLLCVAACCSVCYEGTQSSRQQQNQSHFQLQITNVIYIYSIFVLTISCRVQVFWRT